MRYVLCLIALTVFGTAAFGQTKRLVRFRIMHADPYLVKSLLEGQGILSPEMSTMLDFVGAPAGAGDALRGLFKGGKFMVNAADNALFWISD